MGHRQPDRTDLSWVGWIPCFKLHPLNKRSNRCMICGLTLEEIVKFNVGFCTGETMRADGKKHRRETVLFEVD